MKKRGLLHKQKLHNYTPINYRDSVFKILKRCCNNTISLRIMSDVVPKNYYYYDEMKTILLVVKIHVLSIPFYFLSRELLSFLRMYFCTTVQKKTVQRKFRPTTTISIIRKKSIGEIFCDWLKFPLHWLSGILSTISTDV